MMVINQLYRDLDQVPVIVRALSSITRQQADIIARAVAACGNTWTVQTCDDYDGYLSIMIEPVGQPRRTAFYVSGTSNRIELAEIHDESLTTLELCGDAAELVITLSQVISASVH